MAAGGGVVGRHLRRLAAFRDRLDRYQKRKHMPCITSIERLDTRLQAWVERYNTRRRNHSDYMRGRTPAQVLDSHHRRQAS